MANQASGDVLAERVRAVVREQRIDPAADAAAVHRVAAKVVADHEARSLTGAVNSVGEPDLLIGKLVADIAGFGPLQPYLDDPSVEEIWINQPSRVFIARDGKHELTPTILTAEQVRELVERMLSSSGRRLDVSTPFVDAMLPGGHRLHVVLEGISRDFSAVNIRKFVARAHTLDELVTLGSIDQPVATFLQACVVAGLNIIVSGGTQAGNIAWVSPRGPSNAHRRHGRHGAGNSGAPEIRCHRIVQQSPRSSAHPVPAPTRTVTGAKAPSTTPRSDDSPIGSSGSSTDASRPGPSTTRPPLGHITSSNPPLDT